MSRNIWNKNDFVMCGIGSKNKLLSKIRYIGRCFKWSKQRIFRGYADCDIWDMNSYFSTLIPDMLQQLKDERFGSPAFLGENFTDENGFIQNTSCHEEWDRILDKMIYLWREGVEETSSEKNEFYEEFDKAMREFDAKYGFLGEKLMTDEEKEESKRTGSHRVHFMGEVDEFHDINEKFHKRETELEKYRYDCRQNALEMFKQYFESLWD